MTNNSIPGDFERELEDAQEVGDQGKPAIPSNLDSQARAQEPIVSSSAVPEVITIDDTSGVETVPVNSATKDVQSRAAQVAAGAAADIGLLLTRPVPAWDFVGDIRRRHHHESSCSRGTRENIIFDEKLVGPVSGATSFQLVGAWSKEAEDQAFNRAKEGF